MSKKPSLSRLSTHAGYVLLALEAGAWIEARRDLLLSSVPPSQRLYAATLVRNPNDRGKRIGGPTFADLTLYQYVDAEAQGEHRKYSLSSCGAKRLAQWKKNGGGRVTNYWNWGPE